MLAAEALVRGRGARSMFLEVAVDNARARRLYGGLGYEAAGVRRNYYRRRAGVTIDALVLKKRLDV
jgi:ribosomal-protein-alanine N-acetyltransferase